MKALLDPVTPGMDEGSPRAKLRALVLMAAFLIGMTMLRYRVPELQNKNFQALYIAVGLAGCAGILWLFHGRQALASIRRETWVVIGVGIATFVAFWHVGRIDSYHRWWEEILPRDEGMGRLLPFMYFSTCSVLFRLAVPLLVGRFGLGRRPGELGLYAPGNPHAPAVRRIWPVYLLLFLALLPSLFIVADTPGFQAKYPMARPLIDPDGGIALEHFLVYEAFYLMIFVSGEALWRGWFAFGTERDLGLYGLMFMVVPYVTSHYGKPLPETLGAIAAGFTLGFLALKHRSVWLGVAVHYAVAITMDLLAIDASGFWLRV